MKTILLAEDSQDDELFFRRVLRDAGVQNRVVAVRDGREAIEYLEGQMQYADRQQFPLPDLIFVDLKMPRVEGWAVLAYLKREPRFNKLIVVVLTDLKNPKELQQIYAMGARSFLNKPFTLADLQALIREFPDCWVLNTMNPDNGLTPGSLEGGT
jgi:two-component system response regulator